MIFGDLTNNGSSPPTWLSTSPFGFTLGPTKVMTQGASTFSDALYIGPVTSSATGALSGSADWGTIGVEIVP